jgi:hypothetical protein
VPRSGQLLQFRFQRQNSNLVRFPIAMAALCTCWYNFPRINNSVRMSPAKAAHLTERLWDIGDIVKLIEEWEAQQ